MTTEPTEKKLTDYQIIELDLKTSSVKNRIITALGKSIDDEDAKTEANRYILSVLTEIAKTVGDPKKDLSICSTESIIRAMIDAASFRLPIDGRGLAYLVKYKNNDTGEVVAQFQPGYRGFIYKISEHHRNVDFTAEPVYPDDAIEVSDESGFQSYRHTKADPFQDDVQKMKGMIACLAWTDSAGEKHQKVAPVPRSEIDKMRKAAKQDFIWSAWFVEKARGACLKRICKIQFATILGLQQLIEFDNRTHYDIEKLDGAASLTPANPVEALNAAMNQQKALEHQPTIDMGKVLDDQAKNGTHASAEVAALKAKDAEMKELSKTTGNAAVKEAMKDGMGNLVKVAELLEQNQEVLPPQKDAQGDLIATVDTQAQKDQQARDSLLDFNLGFYQMHTVRGAVQAANDLLEILDRTAPDDRQLVYSDLKGGEIVKVLKQKGQGMRCERFRELGIKIG